MTDFARYPRPGVYAKDGDYLGRLQPRDFPDGSHSVGGIQDAAGNWSWQTDEEYRRAHGPTLTLSEQIAVKVLRDQNCPISARAVNNGEQDAAAKGSTASIAIAAAQAGLNRSITFTGRFGKHASLQQVSLPELVRLANGGAKIRDLQAHRNVQEGSTAWQTTVFAPKIESAKTSAIFDYLAEAQPIMSTYEDGSVKINGHFIDGTFIASQPLPAEPGTYEMRIDRDGLHVCKKIEVDFGKVGLEEGVGHVVHYNGAKPNAFYHDGVRYEPVKTMTEQEVLLLARKKCAEALYAAGDKHHEHANGMIAGNRDHAPMIVACIAAIKQFVTVAPDPVGHAVRKFADDNGFNLDDESRDKIVEILRNLSPVASGYWGETTSC